VHGIKCTTYSKGSVPVITIIVGPMVQRLLPAFKLVVGYISN